MQSLVHSNWLRISSAINSPCQTKDMNYSPVKKEIYYFPVLSFRIAEENQRLSIINLQILTSFVLSTTLQFKKILSGYTFIGRNLCMHYTNEIHTNVPFSAIIDAESKEILK